VAAREAGADVLMVTPPALVGPSPDDLTTYYRRVAAASGLPVMVQDAPSMTGVEMSPATLARLATEIDAVVAIKVEALPPAPKVGLVAELAGDAATVLGGAGGLDFYHELGRGARGTIPGAGCPEQFVRVWRLFARGDREAARCHFNRLLPLLTLSGRTMDTFLFVQKELLRRRGVIPNTTLRSPWAQPDPVLLTELEALIADLGLDVPPS
jgi:4-hydroxy-tetrahydrodipicolinate synthase